ncbi:putative glutamate receptor [Lycorma delicatula]|uniref:putative glutamate receptor n=1 Tax=Lycorma delicatula TaxID=130591 RepID=UPI003F5128B5
MNKHQHNVNDVEVISNELCKHSLQLDTDMILAVVNDYYDADNRNTNHTFNEITLYDLYKIYTYTRVTVSNAGYWNRKSKLNLILNDTEISRRKNLHGLIINGSGVLRQLKANGSEESLTLLTNSSYKHKSDIVNRFTITLWMNVAKMYNFTLNVTFVDEFAILKPDGHYDGMLGELERGNADLGLALLLMNTTRLDIVDFTSPIWKFRPLFVFLNPRAFGSYEALLMPFSVGLWLCIIFLTVSIATILKFIKYFYAHFYEDCNTYNKTWSENIFIIIGAISSKGFEKSNKLPERIILYISLTIGMLLSVFYSTVLVSSLLQPSPSNIVTSEQLLNSQIEIGVFNSTYYKTYFQDSSNKILYEIYKKKIKNDGGFYSLEKGMNLVRKSYFAFFDEETDIYQDIFDTFTVSDVCRIIEIELSSSVYTPCPIRKNSPFKELINYG